MSYAFWFLTALYFLFGLKVDQWATHQVIGLSLEVPLNFQKNPRSYALVRTVLFFAALGALFLSTLTWYYGLAVLAAVWLGATWLGQRLAFAKYREVSLYLAKTSETEEERDEYLESSRKTNAELRDMAMTIAKYVR
jgi:hypothetical protein